jgi:RNase P/RNase MRP subunit POP5
MTTAAPHTQKWSRIAVRTQPKIQDPREMKTILTFSLRALWGDLEPHSCVVDVQNDDSTSSEALLLVKCPTESVAAVRAALTMVTTPSYLASTVYRFDVVEVKRI